MRSAVTRGTGLFFALAVGGGALLQLPAVLARWGVLPGGVESYMGLAAVGAFSPQLRSSGVDPSPTQGAPSKSLLLGSGGGSSSSGTTRAAAPECPVVARRE